jgi:hypothetical protein
MAEWVAVLIGLLISAWPVLEELGYTYQGQHRLSSMPKHRGWEQREHELTELRVAVVAAREAAHA